MARLLRRTTGVQGLVGPAARDLLRDCVSGADPEDLLLLDDLLGIADPNDALPAIDPDARRRRLTALLNAASLAREIPAVYVIEDAHWIDEVSESMLADFFTVIPQTPRGANHLSPGISRHAEPGRGRKVHSACPAQ